MSAKNIEFRLGLVYIYCDCVKHVIVRFGVDCNSKSSITFEIAMLPFSVIYHISAYPNRTLLVNAHGVCRFLHRIVVKYFFGKIFLPRISIVQLFSLTL